MAYISSSFDSMVSRGGNKKHIPELFNLYGCTYFAACCYVNFLVEIELITKEEQKEYIQYLTYLPYTKNKFNLKYHNLYYFDDSFDLIRTNDPVLCYIYKDTDDGIQTIHTFILETNFIFNSWYSMNTKQIKGKYTINELTGKRVDVEEQETCTAIMPPRKVIVLNPYQKLCQLFENPTYELVEELFGLTKDCIISNKFALNDFKNANMYYVHLY
jgi:hypothetical protein